MAHHHHDHGNKNLGITIILNLIITLAQVIGGFISGSMALLSDATHNFSDVLALVISYVARKLSFRKSTESKTFGYRRAEIMASFLNSGTLLLVSAILTYGAVERLFTPVIVEGGLVIWLAGLSIMLNGLSVLLIKKQAKESMNIRSAYLHLFTDMLTSIAVLAGGFAIKYLDWQWLDPVISLGIAVYLIYSSWSIFAESLKIIMQFTPSGIDIRKINDEVCKIDGIKNMHHVHLWQLNEHEIMMEAHIDFEKDIRISEFEQKLPEIENALKKFDIHHFNIMPEYQREDNKEIVHRD
jgi:cobalt-zinc-cadmium efflux system protein